MMMMVVARRRPCPPFSNIRKVEMTSYRSDISIASLGVWERATLATPS